MDGLPPTRIGLNVTEADVLSDGLVERVLERLRTCDLPPEALEIEVTETVFLGPQRPAVTHILQRLHDAGLRIALDDFGTGYASLVHLRDFPIHSLKIDKSFIDDVEQEGGSRLIVEMLIQLAHGLGLEVVAEGVESGAQHRLLQRLGCDVGQGHHYGMAMPADAVRALLAAE
ncbi:EAL domain-containing protein [Teichococcus aestuarii]|uniref:EAL domain-containing protein n=1 Tax=Teichococcus aestuarii TaxID=568898 RepID=UPI00360808E2